MKFYSLFVKVCAALIVFVAGTGIGAFCWIGQYEPDIPKALQKKS